ncbi:MAG: ATP-binding protein, partial [Rariglobus sp.]
FLARQGKLADIQSTAAVTLTDVNGGVWQVNPGKSRPIASLPPEFWVQLAVGVIAWVIAACVWVFRRGEMSARYLLLSGWSTAVFSPAPAVYSTRELGLPGELFRWLSDLNFMGGSLFVGTMVALLLCYPRRIGPKWLPLAVVAVQAAWFAAQQVGFFESMIFARRMLVMVYMAATFVLAAVQWRSTRQDPVGRASLRWFLLSWLVGSGVFCLLILMPQMFGFDTTAAQAYAFLLFVLVYVGLAFGILRFRLFGLDEWWVRIVTWLGALAMLVVLDLIFLLQLQLSSSISLSLALVICGLLWLPLRGYLSNRFLSRPKGDRQVAFKAVVDVALTPKPEEREGLWRQCLQESFDPLRIGPGPGEQTEPTLHDDGLALSLPPVGDLPSLRLEYARSGRALFTPRDLEAAQQLVGMLRHVIESRHAYEQGVRVERGRIARDIHDNIGAQLLSALHSREDDRRDEVLRGALADLRGIINDASNPDLPVAEALGDLRYETSGRLSAGGLDLDWRVEDECESAGISARIMHVLRPLVREATSNVLKHAQAKNVRVLIRRDKENLTVVVEDDGKGFDPVSVRRGNGLLNMETRVAAVRGNVVWTAGEAGKGSRVVFRFPLNA